MRHRSELRFITAVECGGGRRRSLADSRRQGVDRASTRPGDRCTDFHAEIERALAARHLACAELEENDEDVVKLEHRLAKVQARDVLGASETVRAADAVKCCEDALDAFSTAVYRAEGSQ